VNELARAIRFASIKDIGCICCRLDGFDWTYCDVHHLLTTGLHGNGERRGDEFTVGLCKWHHVGRRDDSCHWAIGPSYASNARAFREKYGDDEVLLTIQNTLLAAVAPMFGAAA
jgi:hypothetical protein